MNNDEKEELEKQRQKIKNAKKSAKLREKRKNMTVSELMEEQRRTYNWWHGYGGNPPMALYADIAEYHRRVMKVPSGDLEKDMETAGVHWRKRQGRYRPKYVGGGYNETSSICIDCAVYDCPWMLWDAPMLDDWDYCTSTIYEDGYQVQGCKYYIHNHKETKKDEDC